MTRKPILIFVIVLALTRVEFQISLAGDAFQVYMRPSVSLNGDWKIIVDPYENGYYNYRWEPYDEQKEPWSTGYYGDKKIDKASDLIEYNFDQSPSLKVPGDWNTQDSLYFYYEGTIWYRKTFDNPPSKKGSRVFLYFGAVNYRADVYLNAKKLGVHVGGFTPFHYEITGLLKEKGNSLVVKVDNKRTKEGVPTLNTDWWNYGGITREVKLVIVPGTFIRDFVYSLESVRTRKVSGHVQMDPAIANEKVAISLPELKLRADAITDDKGRAEFSFVIPDAGLWSPESPNLYKIQIASYQDTLLDQIGFRTIGVRGKQILLNDVPIFLRGISVHDEYAADGGGRVNAAWKAEQLLSWAHELNCNFIRLAHYPHSEDMVRMAEKKGILVWSEIPVYWTVDFENEATFVNAKNQLTDNISRDRNRANVIIWSLANETPVSDSRTVFLTRLAKLVREMDNTRLLSAALEKHYINDTLAIVQDPLADILDIVSFNEYIGWYDGLPEKCTRVSWQIPYDKPVFISEFGADAKYGYHGDGNTRWTEEFQEDLYLKTLDMLRKIDGLCGLSPWILVDFRSPRRKLPGIQDNFNRKGLLSEKGERKKAFYILKKYYQGKII
jgi:beta-glucuronidase